MIENYLINIQKKSVLYHDGICIKENQPFCGTNIKVYTFLKAYYIVTKRYVYSDEYGRLWGTKNPIDLVDTVIIKGVSGMNLSELLLLKE